jgi:hypothetical protein
MRKYEIALLLASRFGYTSYLEICTPNTGGTFSMVDKEQFSRRARLIYRCPPDFSDGAPIDFSTEAESSEELLCRLVRSGERFNLVFIDPWHTYTDSLRDIIFGLQLMNDDGVVLLHDCSPLDAASADPDFHTGDWSGVTFAAYLDVVLFTRRISYITVDTDYGCGIITRDDRFAHVVDSFPDAAVTSQWRAIQLPEKYPFLDENRSRLLRLLSTEEFLRGLEVETSPGET